MSAVALLWTDSQRPLVTLRPHSSLVLMHQYIAISVAGRYLRTAIAARGAAASSAPQATESPSRAFDALRERFELDRSMRQCCAEAVATDLRTNSDRHRNDSESLVASFAATATQTQQVPPDSLSATAAAMRDPDNNLADIDHVRFAWRCHHCCGRASNAGILFASNQPGADSPFHRSPRPNVC